MISIDDNGLLGPHDPTGGIGGGVLPENVPGGSLGPFTGRPGQIVDTAPQTPGGDAGATDPNRLGPGNTVADLYSKLFGDGSGGTLVVNGDGTPTMQWVPGTATAGTSWTLIAVLIGIAVAGYFMVKKMKGGEAHE